MNGKANIASSITYDIHSNGVVLGIHNRIGTALKVSVFDHGSVPFRVGTPGKETPVATRALNDRDVMRTPSVRVCFSSSEYQTHAVVESKIF